MGLCEVVIIAAVCVCVHSSDELLTEMGKASGIHVVVRNAYRMWSENVKGHIRNLSLSGRILIHVHVRICAQTHAFALSQYISIHSEHLLQ
jgi:hypothetical protein